MTDSSLTPDIHARLAQTADVTLDEATTFADLTTLHLGGRPRLVVRCATAAAVSEVVRLLDAASVPLLVVAGGSNLVVADGDLDLVVVLLENDQVTMDAAGRVVAGAGAEWDAVVAAAVDAGLGGIECLSGIPGSAGATPVQNVGAYGAEIADVLVQVLLLDRTTGEVSWVPAVDLDLAYRYSNLKFTSRGVVLAIELQLTTDGLSAPLRFGELARRLGATSGEERWPVADVRAAVLELRHGKGMVVVESDHDTWSAGSFFTNPVVDPSVADAVQLLVRESRGDEDADRMPRFPAPGGEKLSAAWLIERAGFTRGYPGEGAPARLSTKHTLALTNRGSATTADLVALAREVRDGVREVFGVTLVPEPVWIGVSID
ncbi:UDP-N-acetylenolpyruvoylglucosamine reductase [Corynebacterium humireducens NBRC 106098 = DSM 45392]|uniref:UDP-N-acetylenolpyruvoylglucosamine reductase n=1 Tax=Corynebacterium humireducens NBRC 106098 = DSM 45392 TaxID=1223515 RepID=A0A0B5D502_9CORY|nr:UDP-N-acetylmuramate dehydrogenase [Corynebacterium humireducens]AJE32122.1 UDP-N-acetylenolpyruvoylglucosamine reductase [Corynebacterium humireducens NBRC 106098 = DSM 45392]